MVLLQALEKNNLKIFDADARALCMCEVYEASST